MKQLARAMSLSSGNIAIDIVVDDGVVSHVYVNAIRTSKRSSYVEVKTTSDTYASCVKRLYENIGDEIFSQIVDDLYSDNRVFTQLDNTNVALVPDAYLRGTHRNTQHLYGKQFETLIPVKIESASDSFDKSVLKLRFPSYDETGNETTADEQIITNVVIDMKNNDVYESFFNDIVKSIDDKYDDVTTIDFERGRSTIFGLNVADGVYASYDTSLAIAQMLTRERFAVEFDSLVCNMHRDMKCVSPQFVNIRIFSNVEDVLNFGGLSFAKLNITASIYGNETTTFDDPTIYDYDFDYDESRVEGDYLGDASNIDLVYADKLNPSIYKHSLVRDNDYVFNLYNGYATNVTIPTNRIDDEGNVVMKSVKPMGVYRNAPIVVNDASLCSKMSNSLSWFDVINTNGVVYNTDGTPDWKTLMMYCDAFATFKTFNRGTAFVRDVMYDETKLCELYNEYMENDTYVDYAISQMCVALVPIVDKSTDDVDMLMNFNDGKMYIVFVAHVSSNRIYETLKNDPYTTNDNGLIYLKNASFGVCNYDKIKRITIENEKIVFTTRLANNTRDTMKYETTETYATTYDDTIYLFRQMGAITPRLVETTYESNDGVFVKALFTNDSTFASGWKTYDEMCDMLSKTKLPTMRYPSIGYCNVRCVTNAYVLTYDKTMRMEYSSNAGRCGFVVNLPKTITSRIIDHAPEGLSDDEIRNAFDAFMISKGFDKTYLDDLFYLYDDTYDFEYQTTSEGTFDNEHQTYNITFTRK